MDSLSKFLSSFNLQIFELLIGQGFSVRDLAKEIGCSPAKITQFVKLFKKNNFVEISREKNRKKIELNKINPFVRELISFLFIHKILNSKTFKELKKNAKSIGVYGSIVEGTVDKQSDIDLWVLVKKKKSFIDEAKLKSDMGKELGREVSLKFFTESSLENLRKKDKIFYAELDYKSKVLFGEELG